MRPKKSGWEYSSIVEQALHVIRPRFNPSMTKNIRSGNQILIENKLSTYKVWELRQVTQLLCSSVPSLPNAGKSSLWAGVPRLGHGQVLSF